MFANDRFKARPLLVISLGIALNILLSILLNALPRPTSQFWAGCVDCFRDPSDTDNNMGKEPCLFVRRMVSYYMTLYIIHLMIRRCGRSIENFITYAMGGGNNTGYDVAKVNKKRVAITCFAYSVFQICIYALGCYSPDQFLGSILSAMSPIVWLSTFKLFAARREYCSTMVKWGVIHCIMFDIVILFYDILHWDSLNTFLADLVLGALPVVGAALIMLYPGDKIYTTIYSAEGRIDDRIEKGHVRK